MVEEEKEEKEEKEWETRYKKIIRSRLKLHRKPRKGVPKKHKKGSLTGTTQQRKVSTRMPSCSMCGMKNHLRNMTRATFGMYYCRTCAKHKGIYDGDE